MSKSLDYIICHDKTKGKVYMSFLIYKTNSVPLFSDFSFGSEQLSLSGPLSLLGYMLYTRDISSVAMEISVLELMEIFFFFHACLKD